MRKAIWIIALLAILVSFVAPIARACIEDSGITLIDGELPGGG